MYPYGCGGSNPPPGTTIISTNLKKISYNLNKIFATRLPQEKIPYKKAEFADRDSKSKNPMKKLATITLILGILLTVLFPFIFTAFSIGIDFTNTGEIGDTIGGITAPIIGLVGSILVYLALQSQIEANENLNKQFKLQKTQDFNNRKYRNLITQFEIVREELKLIQLKSSNGAAAITNILHLSIENQTIIQRNL